MSEYAKNIQTIEDLWKKRIELRGEVGRMSEYIATVEDGAFIRCDFAQKIVRCRDCREYNTELYRHISCELLGRYVDPDGFCAWGERKWLTCKCGEEMESEGKCPSCGRWVHDDQA